MVRVSRADGTYLNLEFRQPWGIFDNFGPSDGAVNGVSIRIAPDMSSRVQSKLVDANPATTSFSDAALGVGQTVTDPLTGVSITTLSVGPGGASVRVQFGGGSGGGGGDTQAPTAPGSMDASPAGSTSVQLNWTPATDNVGVTGYRIYRNGSLVASTASLAHLDTGLQPWTLYTYEIRAYDAAGNLGPAATDTARTRRAGDTVAPSVPTGLTVQLKLADRKAVLTWNASSDNVGVTAYDVFRNGVQVAASTVTTYGEKPGAGSHTYQVRARDAAGNVSGLSTGVTVTTA
jgi:chitodextrinase